MQTRSVPVEKHVVLMRMRRQLNHANQMLHLCKTKKAIREIGECFVTEGNSIVQSYESLEQLARDMKCLKEWEHIDEDGI